MYGYSFDLICLNNGYWCICSNDLASLRVVSTECGCLVGWLVAIIGLIVRVCLIMCGCDRVGY